MDISDETFGNWLNRAALRTGEPPAVFPNFIKMSPADGTTLGIARDIIARDASKLLQLVDISRRAPQRVHALDQAWSLAIAMVNTPFISQALHMQNMNSEIRNQREAYVKGAKKMYEAFAASRGSSGRGDTSGCGGAAARPLGSGAGIP